ncbi:hypothetical protein C4K40_1065 [Pseudomonas sp. CMR5c]|nr:hypothetical protein C4K40_1065 [Pseudomonas sp. CMR5c]
MGASRRHTIGYRASKDHRNPPIRVGGEPHTRSLGRRHLCCRFRRSESVILQKA